MDKNKILAKILMEMKEKEPGQNLGQIKLVAEVMNLGLADLMMNPVISKDKKKNILAKLLKDFVSDEMLGFVGYLIDENLVKELNIIISKYEKLLARQAKTVKVEMITASKWSDEKMEEMKNALREKLKAEPLLTNKVDPNVLAGVALRIGDKVYDNTLNKKIEDLYLKISS